VRRRTRLVTLPTLLALAGLVVLAPAAGAIPLAPEAPNSPNADDLRDAYWGVVIVGTMFAVAINAALIVAIVRFRAARGRSAARVRAGRGIQPRVGLMLTGVAVALFIFGVIFTVRARDVAPSGPEGLEASSLRTAQLGLQLPEAETEPLNVLVSGQQWLWRYEYPDGTFSYYELVVPVDTTVVLQLDSTDVVHRWWIPALGGKFDAVPGRANETWFQADEEGVYEGQSAAFSGPAYPAMRARVRVVSVPEYQTWIEQQATAIQEAQEAVQQQVTAAAEQTQPEREGGATGGTETEPSEGSAPGGETP
jgi:cytochrome c oxidase subunit II